MSRHRRRLGLAFLTAAALLTGWIVVLAVTQEPTAVAHRMPLVELGWGLLAGLPLLVAAGAPPGWRLPAGVFAVCAAATAVWFLRAAAWTHPTTGGVVTGVVALPLVLLAAGSLAATLRPAPGRAPRRGRSTRSMHPARAARITAVLAAVVVVASCAWAASATPDRVRVEHLPLTWIGLDLAELTGLLGTGIALLAGRTRWVPGFAAATAAFVASDAWTNAAATTRFSQFQALLMAGIELPLAACCLLLAGACAPGALSPPPPGGHPGGPI